MSNNPTYVYLKPGRFSVVGFAYGKADGPTRRQGMRRVKLVLSGRWSGERDETVQLAAAEVAARAVSSAEALSGVGTFVGSTVCVSRVPTGGARVWDYAAIVGYQWNTAANQGRLDLQFVDDGMLAVYEPDELQDLAVETYALRPCADRSVCDLMPGETRAIHQQVYDRFNGVGQPAEREPHALTNGLDARPASESLIIPVFDVSDGTVHRISVKHILDYVYYGAGERPPPAGVVLGDSIFQVEQTSRDGRGPLGNAQLANDNSGLLSDSEDDADEPEPQSRAAPSRDSQPAPLKRQRTAVHVEPQPSTTARLEALRSRCTEDPELQQDLDQLITLKRVGFASGLTSRTQPFGAGDAKAHFQPTGMQNAMHQALVNGTFLGLTPQRFVEHVQAHSERFGFFPHPAVLRGLYGWDFGVRGLSVMHFARVTVQSKREAVRRYDMTDFSKKNSLPPPTGASSFTDVLEAIDILACTVSHFYQSRVDHLLAAARRFMLSLRASEQPEGESVLLELTHWLDERLELFHFHIFDNDIESAGAISSHFSTAHASFSRVNQLIVRHQVELALRHVAQHSTVGQEINPREAGRRNRQPRLEIPQAVRAALPRQDRKPVCMRFLSVRGCRGRHGKCLDDTRSHFKPASLPPIVRAFIENHYGGLADGESN
jgi:hypothetical protein